MRRLVVAVVASALVGACTAQASVAADPEGAMRDALATMASYDGIELVVALDGELTAAELAAWDIDAAAAPLLVGSTLQLRSTVSHAAHVRIQTADDAATRAATTQAYAGLRSAGLVGLAEELEAGGWVRIATPPDPDTTTDRIAHGLGAAGRSLLDGAEVTHVGVDGDIDHVQVVADTETVGRFLAVTWDVVTATGDGDTAAEGLLGGDEGPGEGAGQATGERPQGEAALEARLADGRLVGLRFDLRPVIGDGDGHPLVLEVDIAELDPSAEPSAEGPPFSLRGLLADLVTGPHPAGRGSTGEDVGSGQPGAGRAESGPDGAGRPDATPPGDAPDGSAPDGSAPDGADTRPAEAPPFREGGELEEAFGEEDPFADGGDFDCVSDEDLEAAEQALGPQAVAEIEELIELGYLDRC